jgi:hypothetical protein
MNGATSEVASHAVGDCRVHSWFGRKTMINQPDVTALVIDWRRGNAEALDRLMPLLYDELRRVARGQLRREHVGHSLAATALVHEVYLRLVSVDRMTIEGPAHFLALAARRRSPAHRPPAHASVLRRRARPRRCLANRAALASTETENGGHRVETAATDGCFGRRRGRWRRRARRQSPRRASSRLRSWARTG